MTQKVSEENQKSKITSKDIPAIILVGFFWLIAVIVVAFSKHIPAKKRVKIIVIGTCLSLALYCIFALISNSMSTPTYYY